MTGKTQQPVDFAVWPAADGTWQLWSCIRQTKCGGKTRLQTSIYRSQDPLDFGVEDDRCFVGTLPVAAPEIIQHEGKWFIAALNPNLDGIRIARLKWSRQE